MVRGLLIGGLTALLAVGISLVYRANRIINFAQADLGGVPAVLAVLLIVSKGWPYPLAMLAGLAAGVVLGAIVEIVIVRWFFNAPRLILTTVTIFLILPLAGGELVLPSVFHVKIPPQNFASPFDFSFKINPVVFHGNDVLAMVMIPTLLIALALFFRYTNIGIAVRASAESSDRASLLGVPVKRINTIVWMMASLLATIALILRAGVVGLPIGSALGYPILVRALAAAVIGKMEKLPTIFVASLGIGVLEQAVVWHTRRGLLVDPILFVVIIGALLVQRRNAASRTEDQAMSSWQAAQEVRGIPRELASIPEVVWGRRLVLGALGVFALVLPPLLGEGRTNLAAALLIFSIVAISVVVLSGWAGQVSLGQFAFAGVGAATGSYMTLHWRWDLSIVLVVAGIAGAAMAMLIGLPALRIRGLFLAVATLSFALAMSSWGLNADFVHWVPTSSERIARPNLFGRVALNTEARYYYLCLAAFLLAIVAVRGLRRSRTGRVLIGVRENERGAQAFGINLVRAKLTGFAIAGFLAAFAGALFVHQQQNLLLTSYLPEASVSVFTMSVIGGLGSVPGAVLGAVYVLGFTWFRAFFPPGIRSFVALVGSGVGAIVILAFLPGGLGSLVFNFRDRMLRRVAIRRSIIVPSLFADMSADSAFAPSASKVELAAEAEADAQVDFGDVVARVEGAAVATDLAPEEFAELEELPELETVPRRRARARR
jgi:branched-chain amino acid transport system permease protein